jgi:hypothetical protein
MLVLGSLIGLAIGAARIADPAVAEARRPLHAYRLAAGEALARLGPVEADLITPPQGQDGRAWGPEQLIGEPNVPRAADDGRAWASLTPDAQDEWLELGFGPAPVEASQILIYESYNPGAVSEVTVTDDKGMQYRVFKGKDPSLGSEMGVLMLTLAKPIKVAMVRVEIASTQVPGWNEIDAVGLVDAGTGNIAWAESAQASSTYAEPRAAAAAVDPELERLRRENEALRQALEAQLRSHEVI